MFKHHIMENFKCIEYVFNHKAGLYFTINNTRVKLLIINQILRGFEAARILNVKDAQFTKENNSKTSVKHSEDMNNIETCL